MPFSHAELEHMDLMVSNHGIRPTPTFAEFLRSNSELFDQETGMYKSKYGVRKRRLLKRCREAREKLFPKFVEHAP